MPTSKRRKLRRDQDQRVPRLSLNEYGVWHWKPDPKIRPDWKGVSLGRDRTVAVAEAKRINGEVEAWLARRAEAASETPAKRPPPRRQTGPLTISQIATLWRKSDAWKGLRERTRRQFRNYLVHIEAEFGHEAAITLTRGRVRQWIDPIKRRAPGTAKCYAGCASNMMRWAMDQELVMLPANPFGKLRLAASGKRKRLFTLDDVRHVVAVADGRVSPAGDNKRWRARPSIGTMLVLAFGCVQRISDVITLGREHLHAEIRDGKATGATRLIFDQSKSMKVGQNYQLVPGVHIDMRLPPLVAGRLRAAPPPMTNEAQGRLCVNEFTGKPWNERSIDARMRAVIERAIACDPERWGHLKGLQLRDGRRSGFVHLRKLGLTVEQIVNLSGHTLEEGYKIIEHYLPRTAEEADAAAAYMTGEL